MILRTLFLICLISVLIPTYEAFASAVVEQRQRAIRQQQEAIRRQQIEAVQRQRQAYQQQIIQRQQAQQQAYQQALKQRAAQQSAYNRAVQEKVADIYQQKQQAVAGAQQQALNQMQAQQQAYQQALKEQALAQQGVLSSSPAQQPPMAPLNIPGVSDPVYGNLFYTPPVQEVVNITDVWKQMEDNSQSWSLMIDMQPKILTVQRMIGYFREKGVRVNKPAAHYVQLIDSMAFQNPSLLNQPFENIMKVVAIIEYDFDNGQDKDALARQIFPDDKQFRANKQRLGF